MTEKTDLPPSLPPPLSRAKADGNAIDRLVRVASGRSSEWNVRSVGLAALGFGYGSLGASLLTWALIVLVRAMWGVGCWGEWLGWGVVLFPILLFGLAGLFERPEAFIGIVSVGVVNWLFFYKGPHLGDLMPERPVGGFDLVTMAASAGVVWGLIGAIAGALAGTSDKHASRSAPADPSSNQ